MPYVGPARLGPGGGFPDPAPIRKLKMYQIAIEQPGDGPEIKKLLDQSFGPARRQRTAYRLREHAPAVPELCFVLRGARLLCATIRYWPILIGGAHPALLLGPLAVGQAWRGRSLGKTLIRHSRAGENPWTQWRSFDRRCGLLSPVRFFHRSDPQSCPAHSGRA